MSRVSEYAAKHGYAEYVTWEDIGRTPTNDQLVRNAAWLLWHIARWDTFVDIGVDVDRDPKVRSKYYLLELATLFQLDYPFYIRDPQPGSQGSQP